MGVTTIEQMHLGPRMPMARLRGAELVAPLRTVGEAIDLCARLGGLSDSDVAAAMPSDRAQLSRWRRGGEGITWPKLAKLMSVAGNEVPMAWMLYASGFDPQSVRLSEAELQRRLAQERRKSARLERQKAALIAEFVARARAPLG